MINMVNCDPRLYNALLQKQTNPKSSIDLSTILKYTVLNL